MTNGVEERLSGLLHALHEKYGWFNEEELGNTPRRIARFYDEWSHADEFVFTVFENGQYDELIVLKDISLHSMCSHHMLPFYGKAHVAYLPSNKICGVSKLARAVRMMASRPQVQEGLTQEIADLVFERTEARFVMVVIEATHLCMLMRGVREHDSVMTTSAIRKGNDTTLDWKSLKMEALGLMK